MNRALYSVALACVLAGCSSASEDPAPGPGAKGAEDNIPLDGKLDSFASPTDHGALTFGSPHAALIESGARYHSWTFALSDDAQVDLSTSLSSSNPNLDTVMYLYRRDAGTSSWGAYVYKNDDSGGQITSRLKKSLAAGEYRVLVKAFKTSMAGSFAVTGSCEGAGCPSVATCEENPTLASATDYAPACAAAMRNVLTAPVTSTQSHWVTAADKCTVGPIAALAVDYYRQYMSDFDSVEDDTEFNVQVIRHGDSGQVVEVDMGGDEDLLAFVFNENDELVMYYHSEQSPTATWFCGGNAPAADEPSLDCVSHALWTLPHRASDASEKSGTSALSSLSSELPAYAQKALDDYVAQTSAASGASIDFALSEWKDTYTTGAALTLGGSRTISYDLHASSYETQLVFRTEGDQVEFACD